MPDAAPRLPQQLPDSQPAYAPVALAAVLLLDRRRAASRGLLAALFCALGLQLHRVWPYTPLHPVQAAAAGPHGVGVRGQGSAGPFRQPGEHIGPAGDAGPRRGRRPAVLRGVEGEHDESRVVERGEASVAERGETENDPGQASLDVVSEVVQESAGEARASDGDRGQQNERSVDSVDETTGQLTSE